MGYLSSCFVGDKDAQGKRTRRHGHKPSNTVKKVFMSTDTTLPLSSSDGSNSPPREVKPKGMYGYVQERHGHSLYSWKQSFLKLESGYLLCYQTGVAGSPCKMLPLHICMVRPLKRTCFRVICATQFSITFKAKDVAEMREWVAEIQNGIAEALSSQSAPSTCSGKSLLSKLRAANFANKFCADCGAPDPTWASISLGVLVCIECSGVHRSLGSHISKVRSFELDHWDTNEIKVELMGNSEVNSELEAYIPKDRAKPNATSDRETRERWILDKYVHKKFVAKRPIVAPPAPSSPALSPPSSTAGVTSPPTVTFSEDSRKKSLSPNLHEDFTSKLPPYYAQGLASVRPRTPECQPTSHIGSNVFAKKTPYGAGSHVGPKKTPYGIGSTYTPSARRGSMASFLASQTTPSNRATARRNSMHPRMM